MKNHFLKTRFFFQNKSIVEINNNLGLSRNCRIKFQKLAKNIFYHLNEQMMGSLRSTARNLQIFKNMGFLKGKFYFSIQN